jgi:hypothetical protein
MIKRLFFDLETSPNIVYSWRTGYNLTIDYRSIVKERRIICAAWKWAGESKTHSIDWGTKQDDKRIVQKLIPLLESADEVVAHNGDKFDIRWVRGRALFHGIPMSPHITSQDTLKLARKYFGLNSNRLAYINENVLKLSGKIKTDYSLWTDAMEGNRKALSDMVTYCKRDVEALEEAWDIMSPYFPAKTHVSGDRGECPECGSSNMKINRYRMTAAGHRKVQMSCGDCGKFHTIPASVLEKK